MPETSERRAWLSPRGIGQLGIGHFLQIDAEQHGVSRETHVFANLSADELVVPGKDFYRYAVLTQGLNGTSRSGLGRVQKRDVL